MTDGQKPRIRTMSLPDGGFIVIFDRLGRDPERFDVYKDSSEGLAEKVGARSVLHFSDEVDIECW